MIMATKEHKQTTFFNWDGKQVPLSEFITESFEEEKDQKSDSSSHNLIISKKKTKMNKCLNCGKECQNKFCSPDCHWDYYYDNKEYREKFINKIKEGKKENARI